MRCPLRFLGKPGAAMLAGTVRLGRRRRARALGRHRSRHRPAAARGRPDVLHRYRQGDRPVHLGGAPAGTPARAARGHHAATCAMSTRGRRAAADRVRLHQADRPGRARRRATSGLPSVDAIEACYSVAGDESYVLKVRVATPTDLEPLLAEIRSAANVRTRTTVVLSTPYEAPARDRPVSAAASAAADAAVRRRRRLARLRAVACSRHHCLALGGQRVDRVVVLVRPRQRLGVVEPRCRCGSSSSSTRCRARGRSRAAGAPSACRRTGRRTRCAASRTRAGSP